MISDQDVGGVAGSTTGPLPGELTGWACQSAVSASRHALGKQTGAVPVRAGVLFSLEETSPKDDQLAAGRSVAYDYDRQQQEYAHACFC